MGKAWDGSKIAYDVAVWREAYRVLKPGGHLLVFGGPRTFHRIACAIEDAGFEIKDTLSWLYGSGMPSGGQKLRGEWEGRATRLKPGWEPIILVQKPTSQSVAATVACHGTGALNIDACRIESPAPRKPVTGFANKNLVRRRAQAGDRPWMRQANPEESGAVQPHPLGRWPANVVIDEDVAADLHATACYFYCAKTSRTERGEGNHHPTVKPLSLMRWLVKLITPPGGIVLDPFAGSGSTGCAAVQEGFQFIGIEAEAEYVEIARRRIEHWKARGVQLEIPA